MGDFVHSSFKNIMREAYFHEDDYCQTELLPIANHKHCRDQLREIESFSAQHETEFGWTDMYVRSDAPQTLAETRIARVELQRDMVLYSRVPGDCRRSVAQIPPLD